MSNGGSAYPIIVSEYDQTGAYQLECKSEGMSLRDYFAGQALNQATKAAWSEYGQGEFAGEEVGEKEEWARIFTRAAEIAYITADAMLVERAK